MPCSGTPLTSIVPLRATIVTLSRPFELRTTGGSRNALPAVNGGGNGGCWAGNTRVPSSPQPCGTIGALLPCAAANEQHVVTQVSTAAMINPVRMCYSTSHELVRMGRGRRERGAAGDRAPRRHGQRRQVPGRTGEHAATTKRGATRHESPAGSAQNGQRPYVRP